MGRFFKKATKLTVVALCSICLSCFLCACGGSGSTNNANNANSNVTNTSNANNTNKNATNSNANKNTNNTNTNANKNANANSNKNATNSNKNANSNTSSSSSSYGVSDDWSTVTGYKWSGAMPEDWRGFVGAEVSNDGKTVRLYLAQQQAKGYGGTLVTMIYNNNANPPYPSYDLVKDFGNGYYLYAVYPTDVQYDPNSPGQYPACYQDVKSFVKNLNV